LCWRVGRADAEVEVVELAIEELIGEEIDEDVEEVLEIEAEVLVLETEVELDTGLGELVDDGRDEVVDTLWTEDDALEIVELLETVVALDVGLDVDVVEMLTKDDVEVLTIDELELDAVEEVTADDVELLPVDELEDDDFLYNSNLFPAPQYSTALPGHTKLQSPWLGAYTDPGLRLFPQ
jgi:hypothetical protein